MRQESFWNRSRGSAAVIGALVVVGIILWVDIATGLWQDLVILAGLAAGLVTFLLTVLVLDKLIERSTARRWAPVNRLALTEFLHALADEERSEISRGQVVPRSLPGISAQILDQNFSGELHDLRQTILEERGLLAEALSRWASFLAASGDNQKVLRHIADIALQLERVRDTTLEIEQEPTDESLATLRSEIDDCNAHLIELEQELLARLAATRG